LADFARALGPPVRHRGPYILPAALGLVGLVGFLGYLEPLGTCDH